MHHFRFRVKVYLVLLILVMLGGIIGFMKVEHLPAVDALYFTVVTIATVGYGDIHPTTPTGRILAVVLIVMGAGTFLGLIANATELMLNKREEETRREKLNMIIGLYFSELGNRLLSLFAAMDPKIGLIAGDLVSRENWEGKRSHRIAEHMLTHDFSVEIEGPELEVLRRFLSEKSTTLLRMLENPSLLEHEHVTETLRAVFHLKEELMCRQDLKSLPKNDTAHLAGDIRRAYGLMARQWLDHMEHLKKRHPYLFSLAIRTNPFDKNASAVIE